jgi:hypothetical protein
LNFEEDDKVTNWNFFGISSPDGRFQNHFSSAADKAAA